MKTTHALIAVLAILAPLALTACSESEHETAADAARSTEYTNRYIVRGQVVELPAETNPAASFQVRHEPIPAFKANFNESTPSGMNAMIMPFPLAEDVATEGLAVGDKITIEFVVQYDPDTGELVDYHTTRITPLDPDVQLDFGRIPDEAAQIEAQDPVIENQTGEDAVDDTPPMDAPDPSDG